MSHESNEVAGVDRQDVEAGVREYYDAYGWAKTGTQTGEEAKFRQFPEYYFTYYDRTARRKLLSCFDGLQGKLLIAGCGDMPQNHLQVARLFTEVSCIDISQRALSSAAGKLGGKGEYIHGSIVRAPLPNETFDAVFCANVLFHIHEREQSLAVDELLRVTKPGGRVVILYSNPNSVFTLQFWKKSWVYRLVGPLIDKRKGSPDKSALAPSLYFACHPRAWWRQFRAGSTVTFLPGDIIGSRQAQVLRRSRIATVVVYRLAACLERLAPHLAVRLWQYTMVLLDKSSVRDKAQHPDRR